MIQRFVEEARGVSKGILCDIPAKTSSPFAVTGFGVWLHYDLGAVRDLKAGAQGVGVGCVSVFALFIAGLKLLLA